MSIKIWSSGRHQPSRMTADGMGSETHEGGVICRRALCVWYRTVYLCGCEQSRTSLLRQKGLSALKGICKVHLREGEWRDYFHILPFYKYTLLLFYSYIPLISEWFRMKYVIDLCATPRGVLCANFILGECTIGELNCTIKERRMLHSGVQRLACRQCVMKSIDVLHQKHGKYLDALRMCDSAWIQFSFEILLILLYHTSERRQSIVTAWWWR